MARPSNQNTAEMSDFALWLLRTSTRKGIPIKRLDDAKIASESYIHKILKSYKPTYRYYQKPSEEKTVAIGMFMGDVQGAWLSAGYEIGDLPRWLPRDAEPPAETDADREFLRLLHSDPVAAARMALDRATGAPPAHDGRTASERAQGVPVTTVKAEPQPRKGIHPADKGL